MSKRFFLVVLVLIAAMAAGCTGGGNDGDAVEPTSTSAPKPVDASGEEFTTTDDTADDAVVGVQDVTEESGAALYRCSVHLDEGGSWQWNVDCQLVGKARLTELGLID